jgi:hypothetical protein
MQRWLGTHSRLGPFPCCSEASTVEFAQNQGSLAAVFLGEALSQISEEARRLGFQSVQQNLRCKGAGLPLL